MKFVWINVWLLWAVCILNVTFSSRFKKQSTSVEKEVTEPISETLALETIQLLLEISLKPAEAIALVNLAYLKDDLNLNLFIEKQFTALGLHFNKDDFNFDQYQEQLFDFFDKLYVLKDLFITKLAAKFGFEESSLSELFLEPFDSRDLLTAYGESVKQFLKDEGLTEDFKVLMLFSQHSEEASDVFLGKFSKFFVEFLSSRYGKDKLVHFVRVMCGNMLNELQELIDEEFTDVSEHVALWTSKAITDITKPCLELITFEVAKQITQPFQADIHSHPRTATRVAFSLVHFFVDSNTSRIGVSLPAVIKSIYKDTPKSNIKDLLRAQLVHVYLNRVLAADSDNNRMYARSGLLRFLVSQYAGPEAAENCSLVLPLGYATERMAFQMFQSLIALSKSDNPPATVIGQVLNGNFPSLDESLQSFLRRLGIIA